MLSFYNFNYYAHSSLLLSFLFLFFSRRERTLLILCALHFLLFFLHVIIVKDNNSILSLISKSIFLREVYEDVLFMVIFIGGILLSAGGRNGR